MYISRPVSGTFTTGHGSSSHGWEAHGGYSPTDSVDDIITSPSLSEYGLENGAGSSVVGKSKTSGKGRPQRRPSNRDEFDGPHQFLQRPPPNYIALQERDLPHLPTNLLVQEQDSVLNQVNDRLSQCAYDFVAKYQFPIPLTQDMRPVERPQDREWTEWVYLLKRLATKRRIPVSHVSRHNESRARDRKSLYLFRPVHMPISSAQDYLLTPELQARVLYNGQIKQFVTILENSLGKHHRKIRLTYIHLAISLRRCMARR